MNTLLIFFFISLAGITFMIGRKLYFIRATTTSDDDILDDTILDMPYMDEVKYMTVKKIKEYGYVVLFSSIKFSMKSTKLVKRASSEIADMVKRIVRKGVPEGDDPQEVSKFLQMIGEYKNKIKKIKKKIREEEGLK